MIKLGRTEKGHLILASDAPLPGKVKRVEYYREQKIFTLSFEDENEEDRLMSYEIPDDVSEIVKSSPDVIIVALTEEDKDPEKYLCPLVQVGV